MLCLVILFVITPVYALVGKVINVGNNQYGGYHDICINEGGTIYNFILNHTQADTWPCGTPEITDDYVRLECVSRYDGAHQNQYVPCRGGSSCARFSFYGDSALGVLTNSDPPSWEPTGSIFYRQTINDYTLTEYKTLSFVFYLIIPSFEVYSSSCPSYAIIVSTNPGNNEIYRAANSNVTITLTTADNGICAFADVPETDFFDMNLFDNTGTTVHNFTFEDAENMNTYTFYIKCMDSAGDFGRDYDLSFLVNIDNKPNFTSTPVTMAFEGQNYTYTVTANDLENDSITFSDNSSFFDIDSITGFISFIPTNIDNDTNETVEIIASDGMTQASQTYQLKILSANHPPVIQPIRKCYNAFVNHSFVLGVNASDEDGDNITFSVDCNSFSRTCFSINETTGLINFTPLNIGLMGFKVIVQDNNPSVPKSTEYPSSKLFDIVIWSTVAPPSISYYWPNNSSTNMTVKENIEINLSGDIGKESNYTHLIYNKFILTEATGNIIRGDLTFYQNQKYIIFNPLLFLEHNTTYQANLTFGITYDDVFHSCVPDYYLKITDFSLSWTYRTSEKDTDNDGTPDSIDSDKDNDGIPNDIDFLNGDATNINTNYANINITIDENPDLTRNISGMAKVKILSTGKEVVEFDVNFDNTSILDFTNISLLNISTASASGMIVRGLNLVGRKKNIYLDRINSSINGVCIKDAEIQWSGDISSDCSLADETKVECDGTEQSGYTCTFQNVNNRYAITGLSHTGIRQIDFVEPEPQQNPSNTASSSSGGGGSGGGSSSSITYICSKEWRCGQWSVCTNNLQTRTCTMETVTEYTQNVTCPKQTNIPNLNRTCVMPEETPVINKNEMTSASSEPNASINLLLTEEAGATGLPEPENSNQITGAVVGQDKATNFAKVIILGVVTLLLIGCGTFFFMHRYKTKKH